MSDIRILDEPQKIPALMNLYKEWEREAGRLRAHLHRAEENARYWKHELEREVEKSRAASEDEAPV